MMFSHVKDSLLIKELHAYLICMHKGMVSHQFSLILFNIESPVIRTVFFGQRCTSRLSSPSSLSLIIVTSFNSCNGKSLTYISLNSQLLIL